MDSDFEKKIERQKVRPLPAAWREEILRTAQAAVPARVSWLSTIHHQLSTLLWPYPKAWAGLAAVWLAILTMEFSARDQSTTLAQNTAPPSPEMILVLREQRRELAKLVEPNFSPNADKPKLTPSGPRSERREEMLTA